MTGTDAAPWSPDSLTHRREFGLRNTFIMIFVIFAGGAPHHGFAVDPESANSEFSIMTWNLEWFFDENASDNHSKLAKEKAAPNRALWDWRRDAVAARIAKVQPTICALQEVESRRVLWYLTRSLERERSLQYDGVCPESKDAFTEQDVGFLYRKPAELLATTVFSQTDAIRSTGQYYDISKHLLGVFEIPTQPNKGVASDVERVVVMNVHLRSTAEASAIRVRQARLLYHWLTEFIARGENVIVLGDFNTETEISSVDLKDEESLTEMAVACGFEQGDPNHRLVDLHSRIESGATQTHLLPGRSFDRILISPSLLNDDPKRRDLVFDSIRVRPDLAVQASPDEPQQHWDRYWELPETERDLSDHFPVLATFKIR